MSVGCWVPVAAGVVVRWGSRTGLGGSVKVLRGTWFTQLLAASATRMAGPADVAVRASAAGLAMPNRSKPVAVSVAPVDASMGSTRPPKSVPPCPTT